MTDPFSNSDLQAMKSVKSAERGMKVLGIIFNNTSQRLYVSACCAALPQGTWALIDGRYDVRVGFDRSRFAQARRRISPKFEEGGQGDIMETIEVAKIALFEDSHSKRVDLEYFCRGKTSEEVCIALAPDFRHRTNLQLPLRSATAAGFVNLVVNGQTGEVVSLDLLPYTFEMQKAGVLKERKNPIAQPAAVPEPSEDPDLDENGELHADGFEGDTDEEEVE